MQLSERGESSRRGRATGRASDSSNVEAEEGAGRTGPTPRRVVLVTNGLVLGGAEKQTVRLAEVLRRNDYEVAVLSILPTDAFHEELDALRVPVAHVNLRSTVRGLAAIRGGIDVLRTWRPDVLISFVYQANVLGRVAGRLCGVPVIISSVRNERFGGWRRELVMRTTERLCTATTTNSRLAAESLVRRRVVSKGRLTVIPNGIDSATYRTTSEDRARARASLGMGGDEFLWLAAGRIEPQKDYACLLAAFEELVRENHRTRLLVAGQGPLLDELETILLSRGLQEKASFIGLRRDMPSLLAASDALVLSSAWEGLPNIVMEAMASARPVVATSVGGVPELVEHGESGYTVAPGDPAELARAMRAMMALSEDRRMALGERGRERVSTAFSSDVSSARWLALIDDCMRTKGPERRPRPPMVEWSSRSSDASASRRVS